MIICRTPFRISFFGGGTDFPAWYLEHGGAVLSTAIDKYCYITCRYLPPFFEYRHRIVYSKYEHVNTIDEINHPSARECFRLMKIEQGLEIHHDGDLPARSGLGSSSAFTVSLLHALHALKGRMVSKSQLAKDAIYVEQKMIGEAVGSQDQFGVAFGGLNRIDFHTSGDISVSPVTISRERLDLFKSHLMLYFTGFSRFASEIEKEKMKTLGEKQAELKAMHAMVDEAISVLNGRGDIGGFGRMLDETWRLKRSLSSAVSTSHIDEMYETAMRAGALGGKLLGAGGGGFMLVFARPEDQPAIKRALCGLLRVPFDFDTAGSEIIVYQPGMPYVVEPCDA